MTIYPDFQPEFSCKAGECQHTCCQGWEIDIDEDTYQKYMAMNGELAKELKDNIVLTDSVASFRMADDKRCPFLRSDGLCKLILEAREDILCRICREHPRFYTYYGDYELAGTGLSCEKTCEILLKSSEELSFDTDEGERLSSLESLLKKLGIEIEAQELAYSFSYNYDDVMFVLEAMERTEPINDAWTNKLKLLQASVNELTENAVKPEDSGYYQRIFNYIFYRQIENIAVYGLGAVISFAYLNTDFIVLLHLLTGDLGGAVRTWSEQIEYDLDNVAVLYGMV